MLIPLINKSNLPIHAALAQHLLGASNCKSVDLFQVLDVGQKLVSSYEACLAARTCSGAFNPVV